MPPKSRLKLIGNRSNRDAIGAWVHARVDGKDHWRQVMPTRSYLSQSELPVTIGLGPAAKVERLAVRWPDGLIQQIDAPINRLTIIEEKQGTARSIAGVVSTDELTSH